MADLASVAVGGAIALVSVFAGKAWDEWRQRRSLRNALKAEIGAMLLVATIRQHEKLFVEFLAALQSPSPVTGRPVNFEADVDKPAFPVYQKNLDKLGIIGDDVAGDMARMVALVSAVQTDVRAFASGKMDGLSRGALAELIEQDLAIGREAKELAKSLGQRL